MHAFSHGFFSLGGLFNGAFFYYSLTLVKRIVLWDFGGGGGGGGEVGLRVANGARKREKREELGAWDCNFGNLHPRGYEWAVLPGLRGLYAICYLGSTGLRIIFANFVSEIF
jgi:hypothetical protein